MAAITNWKDVKISKLNEYVKDPAVSKKEQEQRKIAKQVSTPGGLYLYKSMDTIKAALAGDSKLEKNKRTLTMPNIKAYVATTLFPALSADELAELDKEALENRIKLQAAIRASRNQKPRAPRATKDGTGRVVSDLPPGWKMAPASDGLRSFFYTEVEDGFIITQMKPKFTAEVRANGLPIPPEGLMVATTKEERENKKKRRAEAKEKKAAPAAEEDEEEEKPAKKAKVVDSDAEESDQGDE